MGTWMVSVQDGLVCWVPGFVCQQSAWQGGRSGWLGSDSPATRLHHSAASLTSVGATADGAAAARGQRPPGHRLVLRFLPLLQEARAQPPPT